MKLITSLRFDFLTLPTPYNFILGKITIGKTMITNDQELPRMDSMTMSSLVFHILVFVDVLLICLPGYFGYSSYLNSSN